MRTCGLCFHVLPRNLATNYVKWDDTFRFCLLRHTKAKATRETPAERLLREARGFLGVSLPRFLVDLMSPKRSVVVSGSPQRW